MSADGVDEILDKRLVGECNPEEVRQLAATGHRCLHKLPRKRPSMGEVSQAILKIKQRRLVRNGGLSFAVSDISRSVSRIENQQIEMNVLATLMERD